MIKRTLFITALLFAANQAHAEASWFDSALNFLGMGEEKTAPAEQKTDAMTQTGSTDETIAKVTEMATAASKTMAKNTAMSSLAGMVTEQLGVSQQQAQGGLGTLFGIAQSTLGSSEFSELSQYVPEMDTLLQAAPAISEDAQGISSLLGKAGKYGDALKSGSQAYTQFQTLGVDVTQIPQYIEITNQFLKDQGGIDVATLFSKSLEALM